MGRVAARFAAARTSPLLHLGVPPGVGLEHHWRGERLATRITQVWLDTHVRQTVHLTWLALHETLQTGATLEGLGLLVVRHVACQVGGFCKLFRTVGALQLGCLQVGLFVYTQSQFGYESGLAEGACVPSGSLLSLHVLLQLFASCEFFDAAVDFLVFFQSSKTLGLP